VAIETKEKVIEGRRYLVTQLPAFKALDVLEMLSTVAGPAMAALATGGPEAQLEAAAALLFAKLGGGKLRTLANELLASVEVIEGGKKRAMLVGFDVEYAGRLFEVFTVMAFAVDLNYADFSAGVRGLLSGALQAKASESISPST